MRCRPADVTLVARTELRGEVDRRPNGLGELGVAMEAIIAGVRLQRLRDLSVHASWAP